MTFGTLEGRAEPVLSSKKLIAAATSELPYVKKWSRRGRYAFIIASSLLFWTAVIVAIRWI